MNLKMAASLTLAMNMASPTFKMVSTFSSRIIMNRNCLLTTTTTITAISFSNASYKARSNTIEERSHLFSTTAPKEATTETTEEEDVASTKPSFSIYETQAESLSKVQSTFLQTMRDRGFLHQCTNLNELDKQMTEGRESEKRKEWSGTAHKHDGFSRSGGSDWCSFVVGCSWPLPLQVVLLLVLLPTEFSIPSLPPLPPSSLTRCSYCIYQ